MTDKKSTGPKGPDRPGDGTPPKRPYATIDLKATEVKADPAKAAAAGTAAASASGQAGAAKPGEPAKTDPKPAAPAAGAASAASATATSASAGKTDPKTDTKPDATKPAAAAKPSMPAAAAAAPIAGAKSGGGGAGRFISHAVAGVLGGVLALFGAGQLVPGYNLFGPQSPASMPIPAEVASRLAALEGAQKAKAAEPIVAPEVAKRLETAEVGAKRASELAQTVATLTDAQGKLASEAKALKAAIDKQAPAAEITGRIAKLEETLKAVSAVAEADPRGAGRVPEMARIAGRLADIEEAFTTRLATLRKELQLEITTRIQPISEAAEGAKSGTQRIDREAAAVKSDAARLAQRSEELKLASERAAQLLRTLQEEAASLRVALDAVKTDIDARFKTVARPQDIASAIAPVTTKVAALETNVAGVVRSEVDRKSTAERIVLSLELTNLKRAMDRGRGYAAELAEVKRISGGKIDLALLEKHQANGLPTLADLSRDLRPLIGQMLDLAAEPANAGVWDRLVTGAKSIVRVRRTTAAPDDMTAEGVIARLETALREGRLADVLAEAKRLDARVVAPAQAWVRRVEARHAVEGALVQIDASLKATLGVAPAPAPKGAAPAQPAQPKAPEAKQ